MKRIITFLIFVTIIFSVQCQDNTKIFNGKAIFVEAQHSETLYGREIKLDGVYTGGILACDSLLLFGSDKYSDYTFK